MSDNFLKSFVGVFAIIAARELEKQCVKLADEKREPVADAARELYVERGYGQSELVSAEAKGITDTAMLQRLFKPILRREAIGTNHEGVRTFTVDTENLKMYFDEWPLRENTADAAEYLWRFTGTEKNWYFDYAPSVIRREAGLCQELFNKGVADNAWIAFDEGACKPETLKGSSAAAIKYVADAVALDRGQTETVELKIYSLTGGDSGSEIVIRFHDASGNVVFERKRSGRVKYSAQLPFIDRFDVPSGYSFYTAPVAGECCYTVERV